jgi:ParB/RepB/Spo0J family partition protein
MTSGEFCNVPINSIIVNREGRQRRELKDKDIEELADSIRRLGPIQPVVVTRGFVLVAGECRLAAHQRLGYTDVRVQFTDEVEDHVLQAIELEENIKRYKLPWPDECLAIYEYLQVRRVKEPDFTQDALAKELGLDPASITGRIKVAKGILTNDPATDTDRYSTALGNIERREIRKAEEARDLFLRVSNPKAQDLILNLDFNEWVKTYDGPRFNFVHCDFPYGIESDSFNQGGADKHGGYEDTPQTYWTLCKSLCDNLDRLCLPSCHFMFWFSMWKYHSTLEFFAGRGIEFDPFPLVWHKNDNVGTLPDPSGGPRRIYETAFFGSRGDRPIVRAKSNLFPGPTVRDVHMSIKPEPVLKHFFEMFVDQSTRMLDPTCGSGSSIRAAKGLGAQYVLGLEMNEGFCEQANMAARRAAV